MSTTLVDRLPRQRRIEALTMALLIVGYGGYYLCRSNLAVVTPLLERELAESLEISTADARLRIGAFVSIGTLAYAVGKFLGGSLGDWLGGRANFLIGMGGAVLFTVLFALGGGLPIFTLAWVGNRLVQSIGWPGLVKISSRWFAPTVYGAVMALLSMSYLFGDAAAKWFMGRMLGAGLGWRAVFLIDAGILLGLFLLAVAFLRESPRAWGLDEPPVAPENLYGSKGDDPRPRGPRSLLGPLVRSPIFWMICLLSLLMTLLREAFGNWTSTYFVDALHLTPARAAEASAGFPLLGGVAVLAAGFSSDRLPRGGRAALMVVGQLGCAAVLLLLARIDPLRSTNLALGLVASLGFLLIGPYSFLGGAMALDLGGKRGSATFSGMVDGFGYLGGILAGVGIPQITRTRGWPGAFEALAATAGFAAVVAFVFWITQRRAQVVTE